MESSKIFKTSIRLLFILYHAKMDTHIGRKLLDHMLRGIISQKFGFLILKLTAAPFFPLSMDII